MRNQMNVGLVADWLVTFAGSEKVIKEFINIFPDSELYSVVDFLSQSDRDLFWGSQQQQPSYTDYLLQKVNIKNIYP